MLLNKQRFLLSQSRHAGSQRFRFSLKIWLANLKLFQVSLSRLVISFDLLQQNHRDCTLCGLFAGQILLGKLHTSLRVAKQEGQLVDFRDCSCQRVFRIAKFRLQMNRVLKTTFGSDLIGSDSLQFGFSECDRGPSMLNVELCVGRDQCGYRFALSDFLAVDHKQFFNHAAGQSRRPNRRGTRLNPSGGLKQHCARLLNVTTDCDHRNHSDLRDGQKLHPGSNGQK